MSLEEILHKFSINNNYDLSKEEINYLLSYITKEQNLSSTLCKCLDCLQIYLTNNQNKLNELEGILANKFNEILNTNILNIRDFTMNWLIGTFFKGNNNSDFFIKLYFNNLQKDSFVIDKKLYNNLKDSIYYKFQKLDENNFGKLNYFYKSIDKKYLTDPKLKIVLKQIHDIYDYNFIEYILVIMNNRIKMNNNKFDIDKERLTFKIYFIHFFDVEKNINQLLSTINYIFYDNENINDRKVFLFSLLILFTAISQKQFNNFLIYFSKYPNDLLSMLSNNNISIIKENISHLYRFLNTSKSYLYCFESVINDFVSCEDEPIFNNVKYNVNKFELITNLTNLFEILCKIKKNVFQIYSDLQLLLTKYFIPYKDEKIKNEINKIFFESKEHSEFVKQLNEYEKNYPEVNTFMKQYIENIDKNSQIYQNWNFMILKNFSLFDSYKIIKYSFTKDFQNINNVYVFLQYFSEVNKFYPLLFKQILFSLIKDEEINQYKNQEIYNLLKNLKYILFYEIKTNNNNHQNNIFDSLSYKKDILIFFKMNFKLLSSFFFGFDIGNETNGLNIEEKYQIFMFGKEEKKSIKIQKNNNNEDKLSYKIKLKILKIYSILIFYFEENERLSEDLIQFLLNLIDYITTEESTFLIKEIKEVLNILIDIYVKKIETHSKNQAIQNLFDNLIRYLIEKILEEDIYANKYFSILMGVYKNLYIKNPAYIKNIQLRIIYSFKQMIYKNVDSQNFRNPLVIKSMYGLNDIDSSIINKKYIIELLSILSPSDHIHFKGFYIRFISISDNKLKFNSENIAKLIDLFIKIDWLPKYVVDLKKIINDENVNYLNKQKILGLLIEYINFIDNSFSQKEKDDYLNILKRKYKYIIYENINSIS